MVKPRRTIKRRKRNTHIAPAKSKSPGRSLGKWVLIFAAILCVAAILGIYYFPRNDEKTTIQQPPPSAKRPEPSAPRPKLTPEQELAALKKEEMQFAQTVIKDFPETVAALEMMGNLHSRHGRRTEAVSLWQRCLEKNPRLLTAHHNLGDAAIDQGQFQKAIDQFEKAIEINPQAPTIHEKIGHALVELGRYDEAINQLEKEMQISPKSAKTHFLLGQAHFKKKQYPKAAEYYEAATQLSPEYSNAYYGLVRAYAALKDQEKVKQYQDKFKSLRNLENVQYRADRRGAQAIENDLAVVRRSAVTTLLDAEKMYRARRDVAKAEKILKKAVLIDPNNTKPLERLGALYNATNRPDLAVRQFRRISEIEPSNLYAYLNIGKISTKLRQYNEAERAYQSAIKAAPKQSLGYRELAKLYLTTDNKVPGAVKLAKNAVALEASAENFFVLGWAYDMIQNRPEALKAIKEAMRLNPKNVKYRQIYERIKTAN